MGKYFCDHRLGKDLGYNPEDNLYKTIDKLDFIKIITSLKRHWQENKKTSYRLAENHCKECLISDPQISIIRKTLNQFFKWTKNLNRHFSKYTYDQ